MRTDPHTWAALLNWCADVTGAFLRAQVEAGASVVQLFDSWAGSLSRADYQRRVAPHSRRAFAALRGLEVPRIHFGLGMGEMLDLLPGIGAEVVGVDWRMPLEQANERLGGAHPLQGNIDPALLAAPWPVLEAHIREVVESGKAAPGAHREPRPRRAAGHRPGGAHPHRRARRMASDPEVLVVGGGVAGLVAARRLALEGRRVTVLEQSGTLGGQVARQRVGGVDLDAAAESFATRDGTVARLLTELGLGADIVHAPARPRVAAPRRRHRRAAAGDGSAGIPGDPRAADVVRAIGAAGARRAGWDALLPAMGRSGCLVPRRARPPPDGARRRGRARRPRRARRPLRRARRAGPASAPRPRLRAELRAKGSLAAAVLALRAAAPAGSQVGGIRGGMFRLVDALAADCERLGVAIERGADVEGADARRCHGRRPPPRRRRRVGRARRSAIPPAAP